MARPRKDSTQLPARTRLMNAFWELLTEAPFADMTVGKLAARAGVNHNTFYYHFHSLDDVALTAVDETIAAAPLEYVLHAFHSGNLSVARIMADVPAAKALQPRITVVARHGSPQMIAHGRRAVAERWMDVLELSEEQRTSLGTNMGFTFLTGGAVAALGEYGDDPEAMAALPALLDTGVAALVLRFITSLSSGESHGSS